MSNWKSYGGINNFENTNNLTVDSLSANNFTLTNEYVGFFSICGELKVTKDAVFGSNISVGGSQIVSKESTIQGNLTIKKDTNVAGNLGISKNVDISGETLMWGNLHLMQNYEIENNLMVNGNSIQMGLSSRVPNTYNINLTSVGKNLGFNIDNPSYTLDISSNQEKGFSIQSSQPSNYNVIARNNNSKGVVVKTDLSNSSIHFFNDTMMDTAGESDGSFTYSKGGNIAIKNSNNTLLNSRVSISNRNLGLHSKYGETTIIYDISSGIYQEEVYGNAYFSTGSALSLVSDNSNSNTGLNIINTSGNGIKIIGGAEITDSSRSSGAIGILKEGLVSSVSIISGDSNVKNRTTVGINKNTPNYNENIVLDINGKTKIDHREVVLVSNKSFSIIDVIFSQNNKNYGFAFGTSKTILNTITYTILYTNDGGSTWNESIYINDNVSSGSLQCGCTYENGTTYYGFIGGLNGLVLFSDDNYVTWKKLKITLKDSTLEYNISDIFVSILDTKFTLYIFHDFARLSRFSFSKSPTIYSGIINNDYVTVNLLQDVLINKSCVISKTNTSYSIIVANNNGLGKIDVTESGSIYTFSSIGSKHNISTIYYSVKVYGSIIIAVGDNIISTSIDGGMNWTDYTSGISSVFFNDVFINNENCVVAVGYNYDGGVLYVTTDGGVTWNPVFVDTMISKYKLVSVNMPDDNTFILSNKIPELSSTTIINSKIYYCHLPNIFNRINNNLLDVCGNMRLYGDMKVYETLNVSKTITCGTKLYTDYIDPIGNTINFGDLVGGKSIKISNKSDRTVKNDIYIGSQIDDVFITGNSVSVIGNLTVSKTLTSNAITCETNLKTNFVDPIGNTINIGDYEGGKSIKISNSITRTTKNDIYIGSQIDDVIIKGNSVSVTGNLTVSKKLTSNSITCETNLKTNYIDPIGNTINIGDYEGGKIIKISNRSDRTTKNEIYIGSDIDDVYIKGNSVFITAKLGTLEKTMQLLSENAGKNNTDGAGIDIMEDNKKLSGYIHVNADKDGYLLKSSILHPNILNIQVDNLNVNDKYDINQNKIDNGIVILQSDGNTTTKMTVGWFDLSNILLCNHAYHGESVKQQTVVTDFGVSGNSYMYGKLRVDGKLNASNDVEITGNLKVFSTSKSALVVSGDGTYYGNLNLSSISERSLDVSGGGNFNGNLRISSTSESSLDVSGGSNFGGNINLKGNLFVDKETTVTGNVNLSKLVLITSNYNSYDTTSGSLRVSGGASIIGNLFIGGNLSVNDNSIFNKDVRIVATTEATNSLTGSFIVSGGGVIQKNLFVLGNIELRKTLNITDETDSISKGVGSLVLSGGCSVSKRLYIGGNITTEGNISINKYGYFGLNNIKSIIPLPETFISATQTFDVLMEYGGLYQISSSNNITSTYYEVFNLAQTSGIKWLGQGYSSTSFNYIGTSSTLVDGNLIVGEYIQIKIPSEVVLTSYTLLGKNQQPSSWQVCGSNNGIVFYSLDKQSNYIGSLQQGVVFNRTLSECVLSYSYYRIIFTKGTDTQVSIDKLFLNGFILKNELSPAIISIGTTVVMGNLDVGSKTKIYDKTESTSTSSGALVVLGGLGVSSNTFLKYVEATEGNITSNLVTGNVKIKNELSVGGSITVNGSMNVAGQFELGNIILNDKIESTELGSGSLVVTYGGASIKGNINIGGNINAGGNVILSSNLIVGSSLIVGSNVIVKGDISGNNLNILGNATIKGLLKGNLISDNIDVNGNLTIASGGKLIISSGANFNLLGTTLTASQSYLNGNIQSNNTRTGTLVVTGGAGISSSVNIGGNISVDGFANVNDISGSGSATFGNIRCLSVEESINVNSGSLNVKGGAGVIGNIYVGGNIILKNQMLIKSNISSSTIGDGSLIVIGGTSISENCNIGGKTLIFGSSTNIPIISFPSSILPTITNNFSLSNGVAIGTTSSISISGEILLNSYKNGVYTVRTGSSHRMVNSVNYYAYYAFKSGINPPWVSSRNYNNSTGLPTFISTVIDTSATSVIGSSSQSFDGEWIEYSLPYSLNLQSYSLLFEQTTDSTIESYPTSWTLLGSNDGLLWTYLDSKTDYTTATRSIVKNFAVTTETRFSYFRFITHKVITSSLISSAVGIAVVGVYKIDFVGIPVISSSTGVSSNTTGIIVNPQTGISYDTYNSDRLKTLVGLGTFAGNSSLVVFGDTTTYGKLNLFEDLNIIGNINGPPSNLLLVNSNVKINGSIDVFGNSSVTGNTNILGNINGPLSYLFNVNSDVSFNGNVSVKGKMTLDEVTIFTTTSENISSNGNITAARNIYCQDISARYIYALADIFGANIRTSGLGYFGNITSAGNITTTGSGNITSGGLITGGSGITTSQNITTTEGGNITSSGNITTLNYVNGGAFSSSGSITSAGIVTGGGFTTAGNITTTGGGNITSAGNLATSGVGNISTANKISGGTITSVGLLTAGSITTDGIVTGGGFTTAGNIATTGGGNITSAGNLATSGVGNISTANKISGGTIESSGTISGLNFRSTSDYRIKSEVVSLDSRFTVSNLNPVFFKNNISKKYDIGIIAHELQEQFPYLVDGEKDGDNIQTVNYTGLIGILINEIKIMKIKLEEQEKKISQILSL